MVTGILLAAGLSRRMEGLNKLLLPVEGVAVAGRTALNLAGSKCGQIIAVLGHQKERVQGVIEQACPEVEFAYNSEYRRGLTSSIQTGVRAASNEAVGYLVCLGDLPFISSKEFNRLIAAFEKGRGSRIVVPTYEGRRGNPVIFPADLRGEILAHSPPEGCQALVRRHSVRLREVGMASGSVLRDLDTPQRCRLEGVPLQEIDGC